MLNAGAGCDARILCSWKPTHAEQLARRTARRTACRRSISPTASTTTCREPDRLHRVFEGDEPVDLHTDDGASTGPDGDHINNANMFTPPKATPPVMQMYLWARAANRPRAVNSGDDASILYHEYTHGLTNRLVGRGRRGRAERGAGRRDRRGLGRLVREGLHRRQAPGRTPPRPARSTWATTPTSRRPRRPQPGDRLLRSAPGGGVPRRRQRRARRLHVRRLRQGRRRAGGPRRRRDLGGDAVGPAARDRLTAARAADHRRAMRLSPAGAVVPGHAQHDPAGRRRRARARRERSGPCSRPRDGLLRRRRSSRGRGPVEDTSMPPARRAARADHRQARTPRRTRR